VLHAPPTPSSLTYHCNISRWSVHPLTCNRVHMG
jgi:hypothetical protein